MRILRDQVVAGYPALKVRDFLRTYRIAGVVKEVMQTSFDLQELEAD